MNNDPNPVVLRKAVRLVHCLQKERGATCAYDVSPKLFEDNMVNARYQTDIALMLWRQVSQKSWELPISQTLGKIRRLVDLDDENNLSRTDNRSAIGGYHRILVLFNALISTVMHSFLLPENDLRGPKNRTTQPKSHRKTKSSSEVPIVEIAGGACARPLFCRQKSRSEQNFENLQSSPVGNRKVAFSRESRTPELMRLLECFVRLKESTGIERALVSSMFAMDRADNRLLNDLVLEVENQNRIIKELRHVQGLHDNLLRLIRDNVSLSAPMERLQGIILREFDLKGFQDEMSIEDVWNLITVYMDKLHSLELLIVEEIESAVAEDITSGRLPALAPQSIRPATASTTSFVTKDRVLGLKDFEQMTGEEVKSILIQHLSKSSDSNDEVALAPIRKTSTHPPPPPEAPSPLELLRVEGKHEPSEWDINLYEIHFQKRIGRGTAGTTYLAKWSGQLVAVKVAAITEMGMEGWKTEVKSLRKLHHPNIIRLLGSVYNENPLTYCLVLEYCSGGDLTLAMGKPTHSSFFFKIAEDIAHGMSYLHNRGIIHRDIKPGNILIDGDVTTSAFTAKVTDFGVAAENSKPEMTSETGTYRWMAPEVIRHQPYSQKADCYSYGVLLWQLVTREDPFAGYSPLEAAGKVALENARPPFPADIPPAIKDLIQHCWSEDPDWRYSFEEVSAKLGERLGLPADEQRWIQAPCGHPVSIEPRQNEEIEEEDAILDLASYQLDGADKPRMRLMKLFGGRKGTQKK